MCTVLSFLFLSDKTKSLFTPWKHGSIKKSKYIFGDFIDTFDWCLFQLIVLLKPDFNCCNRFALSWVDEVTTGTQSFVSVIAKFVSFVWFYKTLFSGQANMRLISQLIKGISRVLQKLLKYFNDAIISTFSTIIGSCFTCHFLLKFTKQCY